MQASSPTLLELASKTVGNLAGGHVGRLIVSHLFPASAREVFSSITDLGAVADTLKGVLEVTLPFGEPPALEQSAEFEISLTRLGITTELKARVEEFVPGERFSYRQTSGGVFRSWHHSQIITEHGRGYVLLTDLVTFRMPFGLLGAVADDLFVRRDLERVLKRRHEGLMRRMTRRLS